MMAGLFLVFTVAICLAFGGLRRWALVIGVVGLFLSLWMLYYHITTPLMVRL